MEKFDYKNIEQICTELFASLKTLEGLFDDFEEQVNKIKGGKIWEGKAQKEFTSKAIKTVDTCKQMELHFKKSIDFIGSSAEKYEGVESQIIKEIRNSIV